MKSKHIAFHMGHRLFLASAIIFGGFSTSCHGKESLPIAAAVPDSFIDRLILGDALSEAAHEKLSIATIPDGFGYQVGQESVYGGMGNFYTLRYSPYLIGMNMTTDRTFEITTPADAKLVKKLV